MELRILIVDDDKKLLSALKALLNQEGNEVTTCDEGQKAIDLCCSKKFDLIITDLMMPGASGLDVLKKTRIIDPDILVILITGFASLETAVQAIREGAYDYITKPFKLDEIRILVNNAREKIRLIRENRELLQEVNEAYKQLHIMKSIIGTGPDSDQSEEKTYSELRDQAPFIAGSMLPSYYNDEVQYLSSAALVDLERVSALKEKGFLTEEEFSLCKSKLLKNIRH